MRSVNARLSPIDDPLAVVVQASSLPMIERKGVARRPLFSPPTHFERIKSNAAKSFRAYRTSFRCNTSACGLQEHIDYRDAGRFFSRPSVNHVPRPWKKNA